MEEETIPVVDISAFTEYEKTHDAALIEDLINQWKKAFQSIGFVIVTGHGVPETVCENFHGDSMTFFSAPLAEKSCLDLKNGYGKGGYVGLGKEVVGKTNIYNKNDNLLQKTTEQNGKQNVVPDYVETLEFLRGYDDEDIPDTLPESPNTFGSSLYAYWDCLKTFYHRLFRISALALGLDEDHFEQFFTEPYERLRLAFYPAQDTQQAAPGQLRYGPHTDYACFAIVKSDDAPGGLEVLGKQGNWIPVQWIAGSFIVNAGDLMQRWTNDCWRSVVHRVANPPATDCSRPRLSIVLFVGPNRNTTIKALETCCSEENPAKYKPILCKEHLSRKIKISSVST
eukprot:gene14142-5139_t